MLLKKEKKAKKKIVKKKQLRRKRNNLSRLSPQAAGGKLVVSKELEVIIPKTASCR